MGILNNLLAGKSIRAVLFRGNQLALVLDDTTEVCIGWFDENGEPVKGRPALLNVGARLNAQSVNQLITEPAPTRRTIPVGAAAFDQHLAQAAARQQHLLPHNYQG